MESGRKNFIRVDEDFICGNCGEQVFGSGYTNHCPRCLFSKHVDERISGDRKSGCGGLMRPVSLDQKHGKFVIVHKCEKCGKTARNTVSDSDNSDAVVEISRNAKL